VGATLDCLSSRTKGLISIWNSGSALGGPLGGFFSDRFGWLSGLLSHPKLLLTSVNINLARRTAFLFQLPLLLLSILIVVSKVNVPVPSSKFPGDESLRRKLARIDWLGSATLVIFVGALLTGVSLKTSEELAWSHPWVVALLTTGVLFSVLFYMVEKYWAREPVMPLRLLGQRNPLFVSLSNLCASVLLLSVVSVHWISYLYSFFFTVIYIHLYNIPLVSMFYFQ
jgi:hypothetical protein